MELRTILYRVIKQILLLSHVCTFDLPISCPSASSHQYTFTKYDNEVAPNNPVFAGTSVIFNKRRATFPPACGATYFRVAPAGMPAVESLLRSIGYREKGEIIR